MWSGVECRTAGGDATRHSYARRLAKRADLPAMRWRPVNFFQGRADTAPSCDCRRDRPGPDLKRNPMRKTLLAGSEEHTSELQSIMRITYAVFCLKKNSTNR